MTNRHRKFGAKKHIDKNEKKEIECDNFLGSNREKSILAIALWVTNIIFAC